MKCTCFKKNFFCSKYLFKSGARFKFEVKQQQLFPAFSFNFHYSYVYFVRELDD